jgi:hypothetical protein
MEKKNEKDKKQLLLRLSPTLWKELAAWAEDDFRSINGQIEFLLTECVRKRKKSGAAASETDAKVEDGVGDAGENPGADQPKEE